MENENEKEVSVSEQLDAIVWKELKELRDTMDYHNAHRVYFENTGDHPAPTLNLLNDDGQYTCWPIRIVEWDDTTDEVKLCGHVFDADFYPDVAGNNANCYWMNCEDGDFRGRLIPGEITQLIESINDAEYHEVKNEPKSEPKKIELQEVWVVKREVTRDGEQLDGNVYVCATIEKAKDILKRIVEGTDEDGEGALYYAKRDGWTVATNDPDCYEASKDSDYLNNHESIYIDHENILK